MTLTSQSTRVRSAAQMDSLTVTGTPEAGAWASGSKKSQSRLAKVTILCGNDGPDLWGRGGV